MGEGKASGRLALATALASRRRWRRKGSAMPGSTGVTMGVGMTLY
jgi:hypothetical protein